MCEEKKKTLCYIHAQREKVVLTCGAYVETGRLHTKYSEVYQSESCEIWIQNGEPASSLLITFPFNYDKYWTNTLIY